MVFLFIAMGMLGRCIVVVRLVTRDSWLPGHQPSISTASSVAGSAIRSIAVPVSRKEAPMSLPEAEHAWNEQTYR
nr:hypothetical protein [Pseudemcibacter aquimaris]